MPATPAPGAHQREISRPSGNFAHRLGATAATQRPFASLDAVRTLLEDRVKSLIRRTVQMASNSARVETLVTRIQDEFLDTPNLSLSLPQAERHFGIDRASCEAVLGVLVDARVLARSADGRYVRLFPRLAHAA
jgi:hypothetical protein